MIRRLFAVLLCSAAAFGPVRAAAQDPPPPRPQPAPDTLTRNAAAIADSLLRLDSLRIAAQRDSLPSPFPVLHAGQAKGFATGVWEWNQDELLREGNLTLADLLRRIPALQSLRAGGYGHPETVTSFGLTRGRIQLEVDGYVLDPMQSSTYDLAQVELVTIAALRVERRLDMVRITIRTAEPSISRPYTRVEAATGQPDVNAFRGLFLMPKVIFGPLGLALDRLDTDGTGGREPANTLTGWAKWSVTNAKRGLQVEFRRQNLEREAGSPYPTDNGRTDLIVRARSQLMTGLTAELFGGRSKFELDTDTLTDTAPDSLRIPVLERSHYQAGARAAFTRSGFYTSAALRIRDAVALPKQELEVGAGFNHSMFMVGGDFAQQSWDTGPSAATYDIRAQAGPIAGFGAFVEIADGDRGAPLYADSAGISVRDDHELTSRKATRFGAIVNRWGIEAGGALVELEAPMTAPFGLPFDSASIASVVAPAKGFELWGRVGLFRNRFALDASYSEWSEAPGWVYLPTRNWRIAGELHLSPLPTGNFELFARLESMRRGPMLAYGDPDAGAPLPGEPDLRLEAMGPDHQLNGYLQIRIIDVRAFIQWEDMLGKGRLDVPGRLIAGPRVFYGVKWQLFN